MKVIGNPITIKVIDPTLVRTLVEEEIQIMSKRKPKKPVYDKGAVRAVGAMRLGRAYSHILFLRLADAGNAVKK